MLESKIDEFKGCRGHIALHVWPCQNPRAVALIAHGYATADSQSGFTLVELLVVIAIIGLLTVMVAPRVIRFLGGAKVDTASIQIERLARVLDLYRFDAGRYPSDEEGLAVLVDRPAQAEKWNGPYIRNRRSLTDPWGNPYGYRYPGEHGEFDLFSLGADGKEGGDGEDRDITSW